MVTKILNPICDFFRSSLSVARQTLAHPIVQKVAAVAVPLVSSVLLYRATQGLFRTEALQRCTVTPEQNEFDEGWNSGIGTDWFWENQCPANKVCGTTPAMICRDSSIIFFEKHLGAMRKIATSGSAALVLGGGLLYKGLLKKVTSLFSKAADSVLPKEEISRQEGTWTQAARGATLLPAALLMGYMSTLAVAAYGTISAYTMKELFIPACRLALSGSLPLASKLLSVLPLAGAVLSLVATEEFVCRSVVQDKFLKVFLPYLVNKGSPAASVWLKEAGAAKIGRVLFSSACFSAMHLFNGLLGLSSEQVSFQLANTFGLGLVAGALQEKTGRVWASIGLHAAFNLFAAWTVFNAC